MSESRNGNDRAERARGNHAFASQPERGTRILAQAAQHAESPASLRSRIAAHLETTARTRSQLPPIQTNRHGLLRRLELWLKRRARSMTRWYVWEQVNFNSATHAALRDMFDLVASFDERLKGLERMTGSGSALADTGFISNAAPASLSPVQTEPPDASTLTAAEIKRLRAEQAERIRVLLDEMRVSFKQLQLELSEEGIEDAPRGSVPRLEELERRIEEVRALCERLGA